jgi:hypothetical protein
MAPGSPGANVTLIIVEQGLGMNVSPRCPNCGHSRIAVRVLAWADFKDGEPHAFDPGDIDYVEPIAGENAICRTCRLVFRIGE